MQINCKCNPLSLARFPAISDYEKKEEIIQKFIKYSKSYGFNCYNVVPHTSSNCCYSRYFIAMNESLKMGGHPKLSLDEYNKLLINALL